MQILIVDDEPDIREGIRSSINWATYGIICHIAEDGKQALEVMENLTIDLVLLDIQMPNIDGLKFMSILKQQKINTKIIIMSGYDDFKYAQQAIKLGASDYLLKPCHRDEILNRILQIKASIEDEQQQNSLVKQLQSHFDKNLPILREKYLIDLVDGKIEMNLEDIKNNFRTLNINLGYYHLLAVVIKIDIHFDDANYKEIELIKFCIINIVEELLVNCSLCYCFSYKGDILVILNADNNDLSRITGYLHKAQELIYNYFKVSTTIGVGLLQNEITKLSVSYHQALEVLKYSLIFDENSILAYNDIFLNESDRIMYPINHEQNVLQAITQGKVADIYKYLDKFNIDIDANPHSNYRYYMVLSYSIKRLVLEYCSIDTIKRSYNHNFKSTSSSDSIEEKKTYLISLSIWAQKIIVDNPRSDNRLIRQACDYIDAHYAENINLKMISEYVFLSPSYFSMTFKQTTGMNFIDYLSLVRINKSRELLKNFRYKTYEVAYLVGFHDEKYFSSIFKKVVGQTPTQYRNII